MSTILRVTIIIVCLVFLALVIKWVSRERLQLRYSLLWLVSAIVMLVFAVFPEVVFAISGVFGFRQPSNFIFTIGLLLLLLIALGLSMTVSWQARYIRRLVQKVAILESDMDSIKRADATPEDGDKI